MTLSAARSGRIFAKADRFASRFGVRNFGPLAKAVAKGDKNAHRNLLNKLVKKCKWPCKLYYAQVRVWNIKKQREEVAWLPFLLPHEMIKGLSDKSSLEALLCKTSMSQDAQDHLRHWEQEFNTPLVGLGIWGDGVPCNYDRSQSLEVWSLNLPGLEGAHSALRFPITVVNKRYVMLHKTADDVLAVVKWSLEQCLLGKMPTRRHDDLPWRPEDNQRRRLAGSSFPPALLCEVRGDWAFYKQVFRFPQHNELLGCCWRCTVTPMTFSNVGPLENQQAGQLAATCKNE